MTIADPKIEERAPVWSALSELFLDTELQKDDHERIAVILAASPYSVEKLEEILRFEITPLLKWNLMSMAGEWAGFDESWLRENLIPRIDRRPLFRFSVSPMIRRQWNEIKREVAGLRSK